MEHTTTTGLVVQTHCENDQCTECPYNKADYCMLPVISGSITLMEKRSLCKWCYEKLLQRYFRHIRDAQQALPMVKHNAQNKLRQMYRKRYSDGSFLPSAN